MKKRTLISILITILVIILTNKLWLVFNPMPVSFNISGKEEAAIEVLLNKKDNPDFTKTKAQTKKINLDETQKADFEIFRAREPKRIKIVFRNLQNPVAISKISLKDGQLKLDDLEKFKAKRANLKIEGSKIILSPPDIESNKKSAELIYSETLNIKSDVNFDFKLFIIISILSFLLIYKLTSYAADFSSIKKESRIEIVFLSIFFIFLFIPISDINQNEFSFAEKRTLAPFYPLIQEGGVNYNFGKNFNDWFNDRFRFRDNFVKLEKNLKYSLGGYFETNDIFINKKLHWMSLKPVFKNENNESLGIMISNVKNIKSFCDKNNIKLYIITAPTEQEIYKENFAPYIINIPDNFESNKKLINEIKKQTGVEIIYPFEELKKASKKEYVYFATDMHWNDVGAFTAYKSVMKAIEKDFSDIYTVSENDFNYFYSSKVRVFPTEGFQNGRSYVMTGLNDKKLTQDKYRYFKHKNENKLKQDVKLYNKKSCWILKYKYDSKNTKNLVLFGDSFTLNMLPSIVYSFRETKNIFTWVAEEKQNKNLNISRFEGEILKNKPDVLIICISEVRKLKYIYGETE